MKLMPSITKRSKLGYSLLETIVAFAVLTLALSALLPAVTDMSARSAQAEEKWAATEFARSRIEEVGIVDPIRSGAFRGIYTDTWDWVIEITPFNSPDLAIGSRLFTVRIDVRKANNDEVLATLTTIRRAKGLHEGP